MKIQIDTTNKVVKIEGSVNLEELYSTLDKLFLRGEWKSFVLETNTTIVTWTNPVTVPYFPYYPIHPYPWWEPVTYSYDSNLVVTPQEANQYNYKLANGVYCIET